MELIDSLNRTMKLAMDEGRVASIQEAQKLFSTFGLRIVVQPGFSRNPAAEAAVLTLLNAAPKTFLGGVSVEGALDELCTMAWFAGEAVRDVAKRYGVSVSAAYSGANFPLLVVGNGAPRADGFLLNIGFEGCGFMLSPSGVADLFAEAPVEAGIAAAGAALNQAFQYSYRQAPLAGEREVQMSLPARMAPLEMSAAWVIGLGHLGQAVLWAAALSDGIRKWQSIKLTDYDVVSSSSLSTCLLVEVSDVGRYKVDAVADKLEMLGLTVHRDRGRLNLDEGSIRFAEGVVVVAVDNVALRRSLDRLEARCILEGGIGDGPTAFTRVQFHAFPGSRKAYDVWAEDDASANRVIDVSQPAYRALFQQTGDECGTTLVAGRSIATPFVGAFAGAVLSFLCSGALSGDTSWNYDVNNL
jgi:hypothetical protein